MTRHGVKYLVVAISITFIGFSLHWQEFLLIGLLFLLLLIASAMFVFYAPSSFLASRVKIATATRTTEAELAVDVDSRRKRGLFIEFEGGPFHFRRIPVPHKRGRRTVQIQIDTKSRCDVDTGPIHLVLSDVSGFFQRKIGSSSPIRIVVQPRVFDVAIPVSTRSRGDNDEGHLTGWGSQLSELVTEYNLGDELRRIHWRTSAKVGKLMVRKELSPEGTDVMLCLDTEASSYSVTSLFTSAREEFDLELFHELFVSLALSEVKAGKRVRVLTTGQEATFDLRHGLTTLFMLHMARTEFRLFSIDSSDNLMKSVRLYKPRQLLFVTAKPNKRILEVLAELRETTSVTIIGCNMEPEVNGSNFDVRSILLPAS